MYILYIYTTYIVHIVNIYMYMYIYMYIYIYTNDFRF